MNLAPSIAYTATRGVIADGVRGVHQTLRRMRDLVNEGRRTPSIRQAATSCIFLTPEKDELSETRCLFEFVRDHIRYVRDVHNVETLSTPEKTLQGQIGDCDDQVTLLCSMFESVGYPTRFVVASYNDPRNFEHVYCQVYACGDWITCDPTEHYPFGWEPPDAIAIFTERV